MGIEAEIARAERALASYVRDVGKIEKLWDDVRHGVHRVFEAADDVGRSAAAGAEAYDASDGTGRRWPVMGSSPSDSLGPVIPRTIGKSKSD